MTTKKRRLAVYAILARLLVFGLAVWLLLPETATQTGPEPAYQGKTLGQWCRQYATETMFATGPAYVAVDGMRLPVPAKSQPDSTTATAIKQMGTNAIPTLMAMLRYEDSHRVRVAANCARLLDWMTDQGLLDESKRARYLPPPEVAFHKHVNGAMGLYVLGPAAAPALRQALTDPNPRVRETATNLLSLLPK